jgi:hypothetical protein
MSGWIKFEKGIETDPRTLRMAKALMRNAPALPGVTLVCGALSRLWIYADSHIRQDNTLDMSAAEIDEWLGIPGFCDLMPEEWLVQIDDIRVELPDFLAHNGVEAKKKALTQKRVSNHRTRKTVTVRNADALPDQDQTRPDQTKTKISIPSESMSDAKPPDDVVTVFDHWREVHNHPHSALDDKRRALIRKALKQYSAAALCQSIAGYLNSPHHMGQNDRSTKYDSIELMLRDSNHIDAGTKFHVEPPSTHSALTRKNLAATAGWRPPELRNASN